MKNNAFMKAMLELVEKDQEIEKLRAYVEGLQERIKELEYRKE